MHWRLKEMDYITAGDNATANKNSRARAMVFPMAPYAISYEITLAGSNK